MSLFRGVDTRIFRQRFLILLISMLALMLLVSVLGTLGQRSHPRLTAGGVAGLFCLVLLAGVNAVGRSPRKRTVGLVLALLSIGLQASAVGFESGAVAAAAQVVSLAFLVFATAALVPYLFSTDRVTSDMIWASLCVYLLLGFVWAILYSLVEEAWPGSFAGSGLRMTFSGVETSAALYYSFVTLTTLGYGDYVPAAPLARTLASMEAVTGQFYVAVLVARLVGLQVAHRRSEES